MLSPARGEVLVADGDLSIRSLLAAVMQRLGLEPAPVSDGEKALELLRSRDFHLAIVDLLLPAVPGAEVVAQLRQTKPEMLPRTIIVSTRPVDAAGPLEGVGAILRKPFALDELIDAARRCLG